MTTLTKEDQIILKEYAAILPVVMTSTHELHVYTGQELIDMGEDAPEGKTLDPEKKYPYRWPVQIAFNHYRILKRAWLKEGEAGLTKYLKQIAKIIEANKEAQNA